MTETEAEKKLLRNNSVNDNELANFLITFAEIVGYEWNRLFDVMKFRIELFRNRLFGNRKSLIRLLGAIMPINFTFYDQQYCNEHELFTTCPTLLDIGWLAEQFPDPYVKHRCDYYGFSISPSLVQTANLFNSKDCPMISEENELKMSVAACFPRSSTPRVMINASVSNSDFPSFVDSDTVSDKIAALELELAKLRHQIAVVMSKEHQKDQLMHQKQPCPEIIDNSRNRQEENQTYCVVPNNSCSSFTNESEYNSLLPNPNDLAKPQKWNEKKNVEKPETLKPANLMDVLKDLSKARLKPTVDIERSPGGTPFRKPIPVTADSIAALLQRKFASMQALNDSPQSDRSQHWESSPENSPVKVYRQVISS